MRQALLALSIAAAVAVPAASAATPAQYRAKLRAVCARAEARAKALPAPDTRAKTIASLRTGVVIGGDLVAQVRALDPPPSLARLHAQAVAVAADQLGFLRRLLRAVEGGQSLDAAVGRVAKQGQSLTARAQRIFRALGVPSCTE